MDEEEMRAPQMKGMERAFYHALDMNRNGELDEQEFDEFRKYLTSLTLDAYTMDEYTSERASGKFDERRRFAGHAHGVDPQEGNKAREAIAKKVVANFLTRMWDAGHVDDETYATEMEKVGVASSRMKAARDKALKEGKEGPPAEDRAMDAWSMHHGLDDGAPRGGEEIPGPEPDDSVDPGFIADFEKRHARSGRLNRRNNARSAA
jgi:hypothetical protein